MILWRNTENYSIFIILIPTPDFPHFYYMLGGNLGSLLYGDVSVISEAAAMCHCFTIIDSFIGTFYHESIRVTNVRCQLPNKIINLPKHLLACSSLGIGHHQANRFSAF